VSLNSVAGFDSLGDDTLATLLAATRRHGFDSGVMAQIARMAPFVADGARIPVLRWHLERRSEPGLRLALLFCYLGRLPRQEVEDLLGADVTRALLAAGLLTRDGAELMCPFRLEPFSGVWILADAVVNSKDSVMPPGPTTGVLARVLPEKIEGSVLEVACGPGGLALLAAKRGASRVLGTDINPRAVEMARFNARLNGVSVEFRAGDLFAPAQGEPFDHVVAQPPFIFHPPGMPEVSFMHSGPRGDSLSLRLLREVPAALTPRGEALMLADVALREDEELAAYVEAHLADVPLRMLVLHAAGPTADVQAMTYAAYQSQGVGPRYLAVAREYITHIEAIGVTQIRHALFVARRGDDSGSLQSVAVPVRELVAATAPARARLWEAVRLAGADVAELASRRVRVAPGAEWISRRALPEGEQSQHSVRFGDAWPALEQIVADEGVVLASLLESSPDLEHAVRGYAERCDATPDEVRAPVIEYIRAGLRTGMLVVEDDDGG